MYMQAYTVIAMDQSAAPSGKKRSLYADTKRLISKIPILSSYHKLPLSLTCQPCSEHMCVICHEPVSTAAPLQEYHTEEILDAHDTHIETIKLHCAANIQGKISHFFHEACLTEWFTINTSNTCPLCKALLTLNNETAELFYYLSQNTPTSINTDEIAELLEYNCYVMARTIDDETLLHFVANSSDMRADLIQLLISRGALVNAETLACNTPLHYAASKWNKEIARILLDNGATINAQNISGQTALFIATANQDAAMVKLLLKRGALDIPTCLGNIALHHVSIKPIKKISDIKKPFNRGYKIVRSGTDKNNLHKPFLFEPHFRTDGLTIAQELLDKNTALESLKTSPDCDSSSRYIDTQNNVGDTPLHYAAHYENLEIVQLLLENGANANIKNYKGETPLDVARQQDNPAIIALLEMHTIQITSKIKQL